MSHVFKIGDRVHSAKWEVTGTVVTVSGDDRKLHVLSATNESAFVPAADCALMEAARPERPQARGKDAIDLTCPPSPDWFKRVGQIATRAVESHRARTNLSIDQIRDLAAGYLFLVGALEAARLCDESPIDEDAPRMIVRRCLGEAFAVAAGAES